MTMITRLARYSAVASKVRVLYGRRLRREDFMKMAGQRSVADVAAFLKGHASWAAALSGLQPGALDRTELEKRLRRFVLEEYLRIFHYIGREDQEIMRFPVLRAELEQIMNFLRLAKVGQAAQYQFDLPPFFQKNSRIKYNLLSSAVSYADMLDAVRNTIFYPALLRLDTGDGQFPEYTAVEVAILSHYYRRLLALAAQKYSGEVKQNLLNAYGLQADLLNMTTIARLRASFPALMPDVIHYLLPVNHQLTPEMTRQLINAPDQAAFDTLVRQSPYGRYWREQESGQPEQIYYRALYEFVRRHMTDVPSVFTVVAYLSLRDIELRNLVSIIECVRYGVPAEQAAQYLYGL